MDKMINISEAGRLLGVTPRTLKRWDIEGRLKVYRTLGNHRRYRLSDVEAFLGMIEVLEQKEKLEPNQEMVQDLVSIITCFSAKIYGARGGRKVKKTLEELEKER
jgi:excisionase family DNA binding protein